MSLYWANFDRQSAFFDSTTFADRLKLIQRSGRPTRSASLALFRSSHWSDHFVDRLYMNDVLGGHDAAGERVGHRGCVNALAWSQGGQHLASGSDDRTIVLWKMGAEEHAPTAVQHNAAGASGRGPRLGLAQTEVIRTGHRANIFSVKWAPNSGDRRIFSCAGDSEMRVFDLTRSSSSSEHRTSSGKEYKVWNETDEGACTHVLRCHSSRAKRISTENSPDIFLSCAEDGEVRQTDLRVPHTCSRSYNYGQGCPRPLVRFQMELYSLSVSKLEPWLFAVAGTSNLAYLLDRRMIPRLLKEEWGSSLDTESAALTHCVRRFGREPLKSTQTPGDPDDGDAAAAALARRRKFDRAHITSVKISESNGRELLASYSGDGLYKFDIKSTPASLESADTSARTIIPTVSKRRRISLDTPTEDRFLLYDDTASVSSRCRRIFSFLFDPPSSPFRQRLSRHQTIRDLQYLEKVVNQTSIETEELSNETEQNVLDEASGSDFRHATTPMEKDTLAVCRTILYIQNIRFAVKELNDAALQEAREHLEPYSASPIGQEISPILDELIAADKCQAQGRLDTARKTMLRVSRRFISHRWNITDDSESGDDDEDGITEENTCSNTGEDDDDTDDSVENADEEEAAGSEQDGEGSDDDALRGASIERLQRMLEEDVDESEEDESEENGSEDDESEEDESDWDPNGEAESEDDENRHGISGGDAAIVYPDQRFAGHVNVETVKDCGFVGSNDEYVWSGSDCGHLFIWRNDASGRLRGIWKGDESVVNVLAQHPTLPICAVSGIDNTVKIFAPTSDNERVNAKDGGNRIADRETILERNQSHRETNGYDSILDSRAFMRAFARHMMARDAEPGERTSSVEDQDCLVM